MREKKVLIVFDLFSRYIKQLWYLNGRIKVVIMSTLVFNMSKSFEKSLTKQNLNIFTKVRQDNQKVQNIS